MMKLLQPKEKNPFGSTLILVVLIATLTTLPWIGLGEFYTKGEPREASVALSMIDDNNWILPYVYANEIAYKPPLTHWIIAGSALVLGDVTPFTSRLPSAIAFIIMVACCFVFFRRFMSRNESLVSILILISCFEIHRSAMTARVDMVLTAFMVGALVALYYWAEEKQLRGMPLSVPVLLSFGALAKGPVGVVLPLLVFGIYLLFTHHRFFTVVWKCAVVGMLAFLPLFLWYYLAYLHVGKDFIDLVWAENFGRFLGSDNLNIDYNLGHEHPFWYNFSLLLSGLLPWTFFIFLSLFALNYRTKQSASLFSRLKGMEHGMLFSLIAAIVIIVFYCIPMSKRGVYLMPAYPFIAVFMGRYIYAVANKHATVNKVFAVIMACVVGLLLFICLGVLFNVIHLQNIMALFTLKDKMLFHTALISEALSMPTFGYVTLLLCLLATLLVLAYHYPNNKKGILFSTFGLWIGCMLFIDVVILPAFKNGTSIKPFAEHVLKKYPLREGNVYVLNNLQRYGNMYGLNFYLRNCFIDFSNHKPMSGYFFSRLKDITTVKNDYPNYQFELLEETLNAFNDAHDIIQLYWFERTD